MGTSRRIIASLVFCAAFSLTHGASAKDAQALFDQALAAAARGDTERACALFEESYALSPASGALLNVAECRFTKGDWVRAFNAFAEARRLAQQQQKSDRVFLANMRLQQLEPKVARIALDGRGLGATRSAWIDGNENDLLTSGALAVMPGPHTIEVRDRGLVVFSQHVDAVIGGVQTVVLPSLPPPAEPTRDARAAAPHADDAASGRRTIAFVVGGFAVAAGVVGVASGVAAFGKRDAASDAYDRHDAKTAQSLTSEGRTFADVSTVSFVAAGAAIAAAVTLFVTAPRGGARATAQTTGLTGSF